MDNSITPAIQVMYSCSACGIRDRSVSVPARNALENVVHWVEGTMARGISEDHYKFSPHCTATKMDQVKIPMHGDFLGSAQVQ